MSWMKTSLFLILSLTLIPQMAMARKWQRVMIPDAVCGSGLPYSVFVSSENKNPRKLAIEFMGGGACWNLASCYGTRISTWMFPIPKVPAYSVLSSESAAHSPVYDHTMIYMPYCTGDTFAGDHTAHYAFNIKANFRGGSNVVKTLKYLTSENYVDADAVRELFVAGSSAGGIGSLFHINLIDDTFSGATKKTMIVDSPGLHWNSNFWRKFSGNMLMDFAESFGRAGLYFDINTGLVASQMGEFCQSHNDWNIGFLQASRDSAMSTWFGDISADEFEANVFGPHGILETTKDISNCSAWVQKSTHHMFLLRPSLSKTRSEGVSAIDYAFQIFRGQTERNYKDRSLIEAYSNL